MTRLHRTTILFSFVLLFQGLLLMGPPCNRSSVTIGGTPVTEATFVTAALVVHDIEMGSVAIGSFLIMRHQQACHALDQAARLTNAACVTATTWLRLYATEYTPKILLALTQARDVLKIVAQRPSETTQEKVSEAIALVSAAFQAASQWAVTLGWQPLPAGKVTP